MSSTEELKAKAERFYAKTALARADLNRYISWHILGGKKFFQRYYPELQRSHTWIFIVACNNSGTSLLQSILQNTNQISTMEHEGQRYTKMLGRATKKGYERVWSEYLDELRLTDKDSLEDLPRLIHDWMRELSNPLKNMIVEKTTANSVRMLWLQAAFPNSRFIGLVRNGYAVIEGIRRKGEKSVERGARHWNIVNKIMLEDSKKLNHYFPLKYENLVDKSEDTIKELADFIGIDNYRLLEAMKHSYGFSTILGDGQQKVNNLNQESIARLSDEDKNKISNIAAEMLEYYDYQSPSIEKNVPSQLC
jgi:hypothetical protein